MCIRSGEETSPSSMRSILASWSRSQNSEEWMNDLSQAVAFLESPNLAHGDLRPGNILLYRDQLKLSDLDCTAVIGMDFEDYMAPYGRILNSNEPN
ncbi:hypothetical protein N7447_005650 [Penicillium robsamsonii]|uniref:uncharacterized protein n=1 Tax=Penicillium robsamsonii TaxID=1792511 RepID=UPI002548517B|nr:uncharacterized protein N7447_005650 [Penicillium robsamsonii]KAJ5823310.1 hypothetical protein N7447_005650 [Penicillium robsamsonii]